MQVCILEMLIKIRMQLQGLLTNDDDAEQQPYGLMVLKINDHRPHTAIAQ